MAEELFKIIVKHICLTKYFQNLKWQNNFLFSWNRSVKICNFYNRLDKIHIFTYEGSSKVVVLVWHSERPTTVTCSIFCPFILKFSSVYIFLRHKYIQRKILITCNNFWPPNLIFFNWNPRSRIIATFVCILEAQKVYKSIHLRHIKVAISQNIWFG